MLYKYLLSGQISSLHIWISKVKAYSLTLFMITYVTVLVTFKLFKKMTVQNVFR